MDARRLARLFTTRWWLIALVGFAGVAMAYFVATSQNASISENWEATAPVLILKTSAESDADYENRLRLAESRARLAVEVELAEDPDVYRVQAVTERGRLEFVAVDVVPDVAEQLAEDLRAVYLTAEPTDGIAEQLARNLDDLEVQILALNSEREALVVATPLDPGVAVELALMQQQLSSLRQRAAALSLAIRFPELGTALDAEGAPRPAADIRAELAAVQSTIDRLQDDYDLLVVANPNAEGSEESGGLELLVVDQQLRDLESQYVEAALTLEELGGGGISSVVSNTTEIANTTAIPTSPTRAGLLGLVLGAALAAAAIIATDRMRNPVHGIESDLALPIVAIVDPARPGAGSVWAWYPDPGSVSRRRSDVQALRATLDRVTADGAVTIGFSGVGASNAAVQALAADVATSMAVSGSDVLLMDTVFDEPSELFEYGGNVSSLFEYSEAGKDLADIITSSASPDQVPEDLKVALGDRDSVTPGLVSVRAGQLSADPVDALAGRRFRELLDVAADFVDVAIVAAPPWGNPETDVLAQRLDYFVLVGRPGTTTAVFVEDAAAELATTKADPVGLVLLRNRRLLGARNPRRREANRSSPRPDQNAFIEPDSSPSLLGAGVAGTVGSEEQQSAGVADTDVPTVAAKPAATPSGGGRAPGGCLTSFMPMPPSLHRIRAAADAAIGPAATAYGSVALVGSPDHPNVGDSAIWSGELAYLAQQSVRIAYSCSPGSYRRENLAGHTDGETPILIHGGGYFGDIWPRPFDFLLRVVADFPNRSIVVMPQTVSFRSRSLLDDARRVINSHSCVTLCVRDVRSASFARDAFDHPVLLAPDSAFFLDLGTATSGRGILYLAREDREAAPGRPGPTRTDITKTDWVSAPAPRMVRWPSRAALARAKVLLQARIGGRKSALWEERAASAVRNAVAKHRLDRGVRLLAAAQIVVTDRLHGHILSVLLGLPHVLVDDTYGKVRAYYETWSRAIPTVHMAPDPKEAFEMAEALLSE